MDADNLVALTVAPLARRVKMSARTFARRFVAETGRRRSSGFRAARALRAPAAGGDRARRSKEIADQWGFGSATLLRHHFSRVVGVSP